jgi:hypothetical protein
MKPRDVPSARLVAGLGLRQDLSRHTSSTLLSQLCPLSVTVVVIPILHGLFQVVVASRRYADPLCRITLRTPSRGC